jgi:hypothetical protein
MNADELRKLAHLCLAADLESGQSPDTWHEIDLLEEADGFCPEDAAYIAAASPAAVLALLDERDEARAAVKRLAGALEKQQELYETKGGIMKTIGKVALQDPVVKRIVEGA